MDPELPPLVLGRYRVEREIGRGGMGVVYEAIDPELRRRVALKLLHRDLCASPSELAHFVAEAQLTSQLEHPGIVPVYDVGRTESGLAFIVMRRVYGRSLREILETVRAGEQREVWTRRRLLDCFVAVCNAVAYAHDRGVLHRDLKPANVMVGRHGEVAVMDWGLARRSTAPGGAPVSTRDTERTVVGAVVGTPGYLSPEQARGAPIDARTDVWALGALLFELLTFEPAYGEAYAGAIFGPADLQPELDPSRRRPAIDTPEDLARACARALAFDPADRHADATRLARDIQAHLDGSARRERAQLEVQRGQAAWDRMSTLRQTLADLEQECAEREEATPTWLPLTSEAKVSLWSARERRDALRKQVGQTFDDVLRSGERALSHEPEFPLARALLTRAYWDALGRAETAADEDGQYRYRARIRQYGAPDDLARLDGTGHLTLKTDPPGAVVRARAVVRSGLIWEPSPAREIGTTPLVRCPLGPGSWILEVDSGSRSATLPVLVQRGEHVSFGDPVPLLSDAEVGPGFCYVPAGPAVLGGDPEATRAWPRRVEHVPGFLLARHPVTVREYCAFLRQLADRDPDGWLARCPRKSADDGQSGAIWDFDRMDRFLEPPFVDEDGDVWLPDWPVFAISWEDARAYVEWLATSGGVPGARLPTEREYERAARGGDGRRFPWGDAFDAALLGMSSSRPTTPRPEPVGAFPHDVSVFGVHDLAGAIREWCGDLEFDGDPSKRPIRGGSWASVERVCRSCNRYGHPPGTVRTFLGFRVAVDLA